MVEDVVYLLDRHFLPRLQIEGGAHDPVAPLANDLLYPVPVRVAVLREEVHIRRTLKNDDELSRLNQQTARTQLLIRLPLQRTLND